MKNHSRLASVEEKRNIKKIYSYIFLSIFAVILFVFFGLPLLVKFAGFVGSIGKSNSNVEITDMTPPAPPQFQDLPEFSKEERIEINGVSENGATITITANGDASEVVANNSGQFNFVFNLNKGDNTISAFAKDTSGNKSVDTKVSTIVFDNTDPKLEITSPAKDSTFSGSGQRQLVIKGTVNEKVDLTINDKFVALKDDGTFSFLTTLSEGSNTFNVKAVDPAGNESTDSLTVTLNP